MERKTQNSEVKVVEGDTVIMSSNAFERLSEGTLKSIHEEILRQARTGFIVLPTGIHVDVVVRRKKEEKHARNE